MQHYSSPPYINENIHIIIVHVEIKPQSNLEMNLRFTSQIQVVQQTRLVS